MKLIFFLLVLLKNGTNPTEGLHVIYLSGQIILKYSFNSYYNSFEKICCKFDPWNCIIFVNSRGQVTPLYEGRISISNNNGEFEVRITDLTVRDAGKYRCGVRIDPYTYEDVTVTVTVTVSDLKDLSGVNTTPLSAKSTIKPTVWMSSSPSTAIVSENDAQKHGWRTSFMLGAVFSLVVFAAVSVTLVFLHKTEKKKSTDKYRTCSSLDTILEVTYILQNNPTDGQMLEYLKSRHNEITEVLYINSQDGVQQLIPQQLVMESQG